MKKFKDNYEKEILLIRKNEKSKSDENLLMKQKLDDYLLHNSQLESQQNVIFQEFSIIQKEYNKVLLELQQKETFIFKLEEKVADLERRVMVTKKHNETMMGLLEEKDNLLLEFDRKYNYN